MRSSRVLPLAVACLGARLAMAQSSPAVSDPAPESHPSSSVSNGAGSPTLSTAAPATIATVAIQGVSLSGSLSVADGRAMIGNNGTITAGEKSAEVALTRGGTLNVCASTKIHLTTDSSNGTSAGGGALMIAMDRGAIEAHYQAGQYSDVLLTPDLRILISPPGDADLSLRVNSQGDTCIDNHGDHAPYVLVSNLFEGGAYRVQPNQRVLFEKGSLQQVVDKEAEPCGCPPATPPPLSVANAGQSGPVVGRPGEKVAKASPTEAENPFPLAESEGLKPPPAPPSKPVVPAGTAHAQVEAPLTYDSAHPMLAPAPPESSEEHAPPAAPESTTLARAPAPRQPSHPGLFHHIGHFFRRLFTGK